MDDHRTVIGACIYLTTSGHWVEGAEVNSAADLDGINIVPDITACASVQIMNIGDIGPLETDWHRSQGA